MESQERQESDRWSTPKRHLSAALIYVPILVIAISFWAIVLFFYTNRVDEDRAKEVDAFFDGAVTALSDPLGAASEISDWEEDFHWGCRRYAEWVADHDQAVWAVERVETVVRRERGLRVFPSEEEAAEQGVPRTSIFSMERSGYRTWMMAGLVDGQFHLTVYSDRRC